MADNGGMIVIDLGYERGEPPSYRAPGKSTFPSWFPVALLGAFVLLFAGASAAPAKPPMNPVFRLQIGPADTYAVTADGQLLAQTFGLLTSYTLGDGKLRWQAGQSTPAYRLRLGGGLVLMRPWTTSSREPGTTAVSAFTGAAQWERDGSVVTLDGSETLLAVDSVRSLTGTGRRVQGDIAAVNPLSGDTLWSVHVPSTAVLLGVPGVADEASRMLLVHDDRTLAVHDMVTGRRLVSTTVPAADYNPDNPVVAGGLILLRHPGQAGPEVSAYDPVTLRQLWTEPVGDAYELQACGLMACLSGDGQVRAIDPATGDLRWGHRGWQSIAEVGSTLIAYGGSDETEPIGVIDPQTGRVRTDLDGWRPVSGTGTDGRLVLIRSVDEGARTMVAVAHPGDPRPQLLAALPAGTGDCQAAPARLICRTMYGELVVWSYQEG
jgi:outer membrane protein assembly factor BamB